ncbi:hypothetical protein HLI01_26745 [Rhizobium laguerreae]|uniref:restriction endonuclease subunit S n=1 Tax=Rhizobium laguerreae TaxID=1076926 RepID=UPI001478E1D6|nr:restriction endonuclease subunit S [Rhizobium laguerreae]NNH60331.1 hypothetical protein [Rhizobium laguerreae]
MRELENSSPKLLALSRVADAEAPIVYGIVQPGPDCPGGVPFVQSRDVGDAIELSSLQRTTHEIARQYRRSRITAGDILFSLRGNIGQSSIAVSALEGANIARGIARIRVGREHDPEFIRYVLQGPVLERLIARNANGSTFREISIEELRKLPIPAVTLCEQREIAKILRAWDDAIAKLETLREAKNHRLDALRAQMLSAALRIAGPRKNWQPRKLAEVTCELTARNGGLTLGREKVMGVTNSQGIVPMRVQTVAGDISRYKRLPPFAFAYNPMRINVGSIAMNDLGEEVLVSPDYVVLACEPHDFEPDFLDHLRKTRWWTHHINSGGSGSVRQRTYYDDLAALQLPLPDIEEQRKIVEVLNVARDDLDQTKNLKAAIEQQKRGLMQKLLTGEWRAKVEM